MLNVVGESPRITHVDIESDYVGVRTEEGSSPLLTDVLIEVVGTANLAGGIVNYGGTPCYQGVRIVVSGATQNIGIFNADGSDPIVIRDADVSVSGGSDATGIFNMGWSSSVEIIRSQIRVGGGIVNNHGVLNEDSGATILDSTIEVTSSAVAAGSAIVRGGSSNFGIKNLLADSAGPFAVRVDNSVIASEGPTVSNGVGFDTRIGGTRMEGSTPSNGGTLVCAGVWDEDYAFSAASCP